MNLTGKLVGASKDLSTGKMRIVIEVNETEQVMKCFDDESKYPIDIKISKHSDRRSLNANKLFHKLSDLLAIKGGCSKAFMKNSLLFDYGVKETDAEGNPLIMSVHTTDVNFWVAQESVHVWPIKYYVDGTTDMVVLRHSKELNSDEFRTLLEGTKHECENAGIRTISDDEIAHISSLWKAAE